jgi:hypothetical protein
LYRGGGGLRRNWGGPLNFFKPERRGFEKIYQFGKNPVVLKMYHKTT